MTHSSQENIFVERVFKTLDVLDPAGRTLLVGGAAIAAYAQHASLEWQHPNAINGPPFPDIDVLADEQTMVDYLTGQYGDMDEFVVQDDPYDMERKDGMAVYATPPDSSDMLRFTAFTVDEKFQKWNFRDLASGPHEVIILGGRRVLRPGPVLTWKALHNRPKDREVIDSVLNGPSQDLRDHIGRRTLETVASLMDGSLGQDALF
jgi:hypothetical protein